MCVFVCVSMYILNVHIHDLDKLFGNRTSKTLVELVQRTSENFNILCIHVHTESPGGGRSAY